MTDLNDLEQIEPEPYNHEKFEFAATIHALLLEHYQHELMIGKPSPVPTEHIMHFVWPEIEKLKGLIGKLAPSLFLDKEGGGHDLGLWLDSDEITEDEYKLIKDIMEEL